MVGWEEMDIRAAANHENHPSHQTEHPSSRKPLSGAAGAGGGDRLKRDEWSEGAVSCLLEAYESKWALRNRAKLKGHDWEDVAKYVSCRSSSTRSPKTQTQCKNKIESMKKRYRSESVATAADGSSSWPLFPRLDLLLRGSGPPVPAPSLPVPVVVVAANPPPVLLEVAAPPLPPSLPPPPSPPPPPLPVGVVQNSLGSDGVDRIAKEDGADTKVPDDDRVSSKKLVETDSSTPALYSDKDKLKSKNLKTTRMDNKRKKRRREDWDIAESVRWLAEVVVRSEQARMETMREMERMRAEAEAKRGEMDLKRTEIIANTQLEIARLFAGGIGKGVDSSLRIGRS